VVGSLVQVVKEDNELMETDVKIAEGVHLLWTSYDKEGNAHQHYGITLESLKPVELVEKSGYCRKWQLNCRDLTTNRKKYAVYFGMTEEEYQKLLDTFPKNEDNMYL